MRTKQVAGHQNDLRTYDNIAFRSKYLFILVLDVLFILLNKLQMSQMVSQKHVQTLKSNGNFSQLLVFS